MKWTQVLGFAGTPMFDLPLQVNPAMLQPGTSSRGRSKNRVSWCPATKMVRTVTTKVVYKQDMSSNSSV